MDGMTRRSRLAAPFRPRSLFAALVSRAANLVYRLPQISAFPRPRLISTTQTGCALPAAQSLQIKSTGAALSFTVSIIGGPTMVSAASANYAATLTRPNRARNQLEAAYHKADHAIQQIFDLLAGA